MKITLSDKAAKDLEKLKEKLGFKTLEEHLVEAGIFPKRKKKKSEPLTAEIG